MPLLSEREKMDIFGYSKSPYQIKEAIRRDLNGLPEAVRGEDAWYVGSAPLNRTLEWQVPDPLMAKKKYLYMRAAMEEFRGRSFEKMALTRVVKETQRIEAERIASEQELLNLDVPLDREHIKKVIEIATEPLVKEMQSVKEGINALAERKMKQLLPKSLVYNYYRYAGSVLRMGGFYYKTPEQKGGLEFWIEPDLPSYVPQDECCKLLVECCTPYNLMSLDKKIKDYDTLRRKKVALEYSIASRFLQDASRRTYRHLLKTNPAWFITLFNYLKEQNNGSWKQNETAGT